MTDRWWEDDDQLLALLKDALDNARSVSREFIEAGQAAYAWHGIDMQLAALTYDSAVDAGLVSAGTRAEPAALRSLAFACADLTIELEITNDALVGQLAPARAGEAVLIRLGGFDSAAATRDEASFFDSATATTNEASFFDPAATATNEASFFDSPATATNEASFFDSPAAITNEASAVDAAAAITDEVGFFAVRPVPAEPFRLLIRTTSGRAVLTGWISP